MLLNPDKNLWFIVRDSNRFNLESNFLLAWDDAINIITHLIGFFIRLNQSTADGFKMHNSQKFNVITNESVGKTAEELRFMLTSTTNNL